MSPPGPAAFCLDSWVFIDSVSFTGHVICFFGCVLAGCIFQRTDLFPISCQICGHAVVCSLPLWSLSVHGVCSDAFSLVCDVGFPCILSVSISPAHLFWLPWRGVYRSLSIFPENRLWFRWFSLLIPYFKLCSNSLFCLLWAWLTLLLLLIVSLGVSPFQTCTFNAACSPPSAALAASHRFC